MNDRLHTDVLKLFPLPLTSMERFHLFDSNPEYPNLIFGRLLIDGTVDPRLARQAWNFVCRRQPLLQANIEQVQGKWTWRIDPDAAVPNEPGWHYEELEHPPGPWSVDCHQSRSVPLSPGLVIRTWPTADDSQQRITEVLTHGHHAVGDGAAAVGIVMDWIRAYDNLANGQEVGARFPELSIKRLNTRDRLDLWSWNYLRFLPLQLVGLFGATKFIFRSTATLAPDVMPEPESPVIFPSIQSGWITPAVTERLRDRAIELGISRNAFLMGAVFRTLAAWRQRDQPTTPKLGNDWIRLILPINIRNIGDRRMPAINRTSIVQIDRRRIGDANFDQLVRSIDQEVKVIHRWQLDKMFLLFMRALSVSDSWLKSTASNPKSRGMAVFTNLGRPFRAAGGQKPNRIGLMELISEFDFAGPIRQGTPLNFAFAELNGRIRISLHYDARVVAMKSAEQLVHELVHQTVEAVGVSCGEAASDSD